MAKIEIEPIGFVRGARQTAEDDFWGGRTSSIVLDDRFEAGALAGLEEFSHVEVIFHFDRADPAKIVTGARHPRNNAAWPEVGVFAQRAKGRPNRLGSTICRILAVEDRALRVLELDAIEGTPVIDLKPVMAEFLPRGAIRQPPWSVELMREYWSAADESGSE